jgi:hypothetical protein
MSKNNRYQRALDIARKSTKLLVAIAGQTYITDTEKPISPINTCDSILHQTKEIRRELEDETST